MAASLFEEYEQAAIDFAVASAEEDAKLCAVRRLFEKSERAAAKAAAEAGAALALSSFAVCALFVGAERKKVAEEAALLRASVDVEAAVRAMVVRAERAVAAASAAAAAAAPSADLAPAAAAEAEGSSSNSANVRRSASRPSLSSLCLLPLCSRPAGRRGGLRG